jgi:hypothetical protein
MMRILRVSTSVFLALLISSTGCKVKQGESDLRSDLQENYNLQEMVNGFKWGKGLNATSLKGMKAILRKEKSIVIPIGNSGALYTPEFGEIAMKVLEGMPSGGAWLFDFNTEAKKFDKASDKIYPDINSLAAEVASKSKTYGMTTQKALESEYEPKVLEAFKAPSNRPVAVSLVDDWDTGFHRELADWAKEVRTREFHVVIIGGGEISQTQGQSWIDAAKDQSNIFLTLEIGAQSGNPKKHYNASARLLKDNYASLKKVYNAKRLVIVKEGRGLTSFPSEREIEELIPADPAK